VINVRAFGPRGGVMGEGAVEDHLSGSERRPGFEVDFRLVDACMFGKVRV
jgi:hypothetical protein